MSQFKSPVPLCNVTILVVNDVRGSVCLSFRHTLEFHQENSSRSIYNVILFRHPIGSRQYPHSGYFLGFIISQCSCLFRRNVWFKPISLACLFLLDCIRNLIRQSYKTLKIELCRNDVSGRFITPRPNGFE